MDHRLMLLSSQKKGKTRGAETCPVLVTLVALVGIGTSVFFAQFPHAPAIFAGPTNPQGTGNPAEPLVIIPKGILPQTAPELFNPDNLYEKINGQAELYLSAGFRRLKSQSFAKADNSDLWVDLYVYDMGNVLNAFAVFSMQRRDEGDPVKLGQFSYRTEDALFFVHGPYYVEIIASAPKREVAEMMHSLAEIFIRENQVEVKPIPELSQFPRSNLMENSITLIPSNAFGYDGLNRVFTASYSLGGKKVTAFISHRESPLKAEELALKYHAFLMRYGGKNAKPGIRIKNSRVVKISEAYEVIFTHGPYLAGVHEATDKAQAETLADMVHEKLVTFKSVDKVY
jgi:hypothetical protein